MWNGEAINCLVNSLALKLSNGLVLGLAVISLFYQSDSFAAPRDRNKPISGYTKLLGRSSRFPSPDLSTSGRLKAVGIKPSGNDGQGTLAPWSDLTAGASFWASTNGPPGGNVYSICVDDSNGYVYAGTDSGVFRSTDNGGGWTQVAAGSPVRTVAVGSNGFVYAGTSSGIYLSTDAGVSWYITTMTYQTMSLAAAPSGAILAGTASNGIYASTDNGTSWFQVAVSSGEEVYSLAVSSSGYIFAAAYDASNPNLEGVYRSTDGGGTWTQVGLANDWVWALAVSSTGNVFAGTYGLGVYLSTDGGSTWTQEDSGLTNTLIYSLVVNSSGDIFAGSDGNGVFESTDNGSVWTVTGPTNRTFWALAVNDSGYVFAGADSGGIYRSANPTINGTLPAAPTLVSPANGSAGISSNPTLSWISSSGASSYRLQVFNDTTIQVDTAGLISPSVSLSGLFQGTTYYWRVDASDSAGTSPWSSLWQFTTVNAASVPGPPTLSSPADSSTGIAMNPTLTWLASSGAISYDVQVSTDGTFTQSAKIVFDTTGVTDESITLNELPANATYYWRVDATNTAGTGVWSSVWVFTTGNISLPGPPALISPANGATGLAADLRLSWSSSAGATSYGLELATDSTFRSILTDTAGIASSTDSLTGLSASTTYYWRVDADYEGGRGAWSTTWSFTTTARSPLSPPMLVSPADGSTGSTTFMMLSWNAVPNATFYDLELSTDTTFHGILVAKRGLTTTSTEVAGLSEGTTYYWRVRAGVQNDSSAWSTPWSFSTFAYPSVLSISKQFSFTGFLDSTNYQIIGLPGNLDTLIGSVVGGTQGKGWNAFWDNGDSVNYYVKYNGSPTFDFKAGRAFWILSKTPFQVSQDVPAVPLDSNDSYTVPLHNGWNLVSDPFEKSVGWNSVQSLNGTAQPIWAFFNDAYSQSSSMVPYVGYYFYNDAGLSGLKIPYVYSPGLQSATTQSRLANASVTATLKERSVGIGSITVGLRQTSLIPSEIYAPPGGFERARISIVDSAASSAWKEFVSDLKDGIGPGMEFKFHVRNNTGTRLGLHFRVGSGLAGYQVYLIDDDLHKAYNLNETACVEIAPYENFKQYSILIGTDAFVAPKLKELSPREFTLFQNYPDPFNPVTTIRFEIPSTQHVSLDVYDVLGREVQNLINSDLAAGYYEVQFNGDRFASGVYFYRLQDGTTSITRKMILIK